MRLKDGALVDEKSGLDQTAHVYKESGKSFTAVLGRVDIALGLNAYYKLQLLECDTNKKYVLQLLA